VYLLSRLGVPKDRVIHLLIAAALLLVAVLLVFLCRLAAGRLVRIALVGALFAELLFFVNWIRPVRVDGDEQGNRVVRLLQQSCGLDRVLTIGSRGLPPNWGAALGISQADSLDGVNLRWYAEYFRANFAVTDHFIALRDDQRSRDVVTDEVVNRDALDLLGVRFIVVDGGMKAFEDYFLEQGFPVALRDPAVVVFENPSRFPRAYAVSRVERAPWTPDVDGLSARNVAYTEDQQLIEEAATAGLVEGDDHRHAVESKVTLLRYHHAELALKVELSEPELLVLSDTWHPNWQARIDGEPCHLGRVNHAFRGVVVPPGSHVVTMVYTPGGLRLGLVLSTIGMLAVGCLAMWPLLRMRWQWTGKRAGPPRAPS
jgi:hypothetical protein